MSVTVEIDGAEELEQAAEELQRVSEKHADRALRRSALKLQDNIANEKLSGGGSGRTYDWKVQLATGETPDLTVDLPNVQGRLPAFERNTPHTASAPGEPPASDTGKLRQSIDWRMEGRRNAIVFTDIDYAPHLEFGTEHMEPRPFFEPAFHDKMDDMVEIFEQEMEAGLNG